MKPNLLWLFFLVFCLGKMGAQPFNMNPKIEPIEIQLAAFEPSGNGGEALKGKLQVLKVRQEKDTLYYFVKGLSIYSLMYVAVASADPGNPIKVQLHKINWEKANRSGTTNSKGQWSEKFKTEGDFGVMTIPQKKPAEFSLLVWAGAEDTAALPSVFKNDADSKTQKNAEGKSGGSPLLYGIIGFLVAVIGFLLIRMKKSKN